MITKKQSRARRAKRSRAKIASLGINRLCVHKSNQHIYAQVIAPEGATVITAASTRDKSLNSNSGSNVDAAKKVGELIAQRAKDKGIKKVAFDRSGFKYHGRVRALADAARESGLQF